jgi:hypothetical protein
MLELFRVGERTILSKLTKSLLGTCKVYVEDADQ